MKLTKNFKKSEFDSKDGSHMPYTVLSNVKELAKNLQIIRDYFNKKIKINSGYRSPSHNKNVGGSKNSKHLLGKAADIVVERTSPSQVYKGIEKLIREGKIKQGGLSKYNTFVHYDIRGIKARW